MELRVGSTLPVYGGPRDGETMCYLGEKTRCVISWNGVEHRYKVWKRALPFIAGGVTTVGNCPVWEYDGLAPVK
jgi:hypothetical protein